MRGKTIVCVMGSLGLLLGAGAAWGNQQMDTTGSGSDTSAAPSSSGSEAPATQVAGKPECRDAGVTVAFKTGSAELDQNARGALDGVATWMKADENRVMHLEGFADTTGNSEANLVLSAHRAEAVKTYLIDHGVASSKVMTVGRGEEVDHLPANGRAVTFLACQPAKVGAAVAEDNKEAEAAAAPVAEAPPRGSASGGSGDHDSASGGSQAVLGAWFRLGDDGGWCLPGLHQHRYEVDDPGRWWLGGALHRRNELDHRVRGRLHRRGEPVPGSGRHEPTRRCWFRTVWRVTPA